MEWLRRVPLSVRIIVVVALSSAVALVVFFRLIVKQQERIYLDNLYRGASHISETLRLMTYHDMLEDRRDAVYRMLGKVSSLEGVNRIRIFNKEGRITYSNLAGEQGRVVDKESEACYTCHQKDTPLARIATHERFRVFQDPEKGRSLGLIQPIYNEKACYSAPCHYHPPERQLLGVLDIHMSLAGMDRAVAHGVRWLSFFTLCFTVVIPLLAGVFIYRLVHRPIRTLTAATTQIAGGDWNCRVAGPSGGEIGALADSFNAMADRLQQAHQELREWAETLEQRVDDKTRELQLAQDQVIQAEKMASLGRLAAVVAHEINNPLTGILTYAKLIQKQLGKTGLDDGKVRSMIANLATMEKETARCGRLVKELLSYARGSDDVRQPVDINEVIRAVVDLMAYRLTQQKIELRLELQPDLPTLAGHPDRLEQAVLNLVNNACEAMPDGGRLGIRTALGPAGDCLEIRIADTGPGIPEEMRAQLFDPFISTKSRGENLGLGLFVTNGHIQRHGGRISVVTEIGEGTEFTISLPVTAPQEEPTHERG